MLLTRTIYLKVKLNRKVVVVVLARKRKNER